MHKGTEVQLCLRVVANVIGCLANGGRDVKNRSQSMLFIPHYDTSHSRKATYLHIVAEDKACKIEKKRNRFTVGDDRIEYKGKLATPTSHLTTIKIHRNSVVSTQGVKYNTADITNFYLKNLLYIYEYIRINIHDIRDEIIK